MDAFNMLILTWFPDTDDEDVDACTFDEFAEANDPADVAIVRALDPGESHTFGGGASAEVRVTVSLEARSPRVRP